MKDETKHESVKGRSRCGRGNTRTTKKENVTCGRCKLLAKFAAKREKGK
jgi:hypothetical protein